MAVKFQGGKAVPMHQDSSRERARQAIMKLRGPIDEATRSVEAIRDLPPSVKTFVLQRLRGLDAIYLAQTIELGQQL
jgi:hypothetical protein